MTTDQERQRIWDARFLALAEHIAQWSKDPSTQTGAVIVDGRKVVSLGYNGFAQGVNDTAERLGVREVKYKMVVHCEVNAILFANRSLAGCTLYTWPFQSCAPCSAIVIQTGIKRCVAPVASKDLQERWKDDIQLAQIMFSEADVEFVELT